MVKRRRETTIKNRRHLARLEREQLQSKYITITSIAIVSTILILVMVGFIIERFVKPGQPVAVVNGVEISTHEFQARVRYERNQLVNQYMNTVQFMQQFGNDPNTQAFFQNSLSQIEFQLDPGSIGRDILNTLIANELIKQEAAERGITVTEDEIDKAMEKFFGYYGGEQPPTPTDVPTSQPTSTLTPLQMTLTAPTPTPVLTSTESLTPTEMLTPTETITVTPTATVPPPTPTPYTLEAFEKDLDESIRFLRRLQFAEADLRKLVESQLYRDKLLDAITAELPREHDQVWARHILVEDEETALDVLTQLENGADFTALVEEYSTDAATLSSGGDLGWFGTGKMAPDFEKVAFNLEIGAISDPVQSTFGWHIIQVLGHEMRSLSSAEYEQLRRDTFEEWLSRTRLTADIQTMEYWADRVPTKPGLPPNVGALANP